MDTQQFHHAPELVPKPRLTVYGGPIAWRRLLATTVLFSVVTGGILVALESRHPEPPAVKPAGNTAGYQSPMGLRVTIRKQQVEIRWDHDLVAALKLGKGLIRITDGETTKLIPLDWRDLQDGYVSYTPLTSDVHVRFEIIEADGVGISESTRVVAIP
jgi:hypothetical protein